MDVVVASPSGGAAYENVGYVSIWAVEGQLGIMPGHADLIAALRPGVVRIETPDGHVNGVCGSGFIRIESGNIHISAEQWTENPAAVDVATRQAEIDVILTDDTTGTATKAKLKRERAFLQACSA